MALYMTYDVIHEESHIVKVLIRNNKKDRTTRYIALSTAYRYKKT